MTPKVIPLKAESRIYDHLYVKYAVKIPEEAVGQIALMYPPEDINDYTIVPKTIGPVDTSSGWTHMVYALTINDLLSRSGNRAYKLDDVVANLVIFEEGLEDFQQEGYDE